MKRKKIKNLFIYLRYLIIRYLINLNFSNFKINKIRIHKVSNSDITFFGYYNISPSNNENEILFLSVKNEIVRGSRYEKANIMLKNKNNIFKIGQTKAWNWQQGCMLQWFPKTNDKIIFNDYCEEKNDYVSKLIDKKGNLIKVFDLPINSISKTGEYALCLNYDRLALLRPDYGYFSKSNLILTDDEKDGIWLLDLNTGKTKLIISLYQLKILKYSSTMKNAIHKVNHIDINPTGTRFMFIHRWMGPDGRFMRLITANKDGTDIFILNGDKMTSHCCWINNYRILSFSHVENKGNGYFIFEDKKQNISFFSKKIPKVDGHPALSPDGKYLVIDTYPDKSRMSHLYLYNINKNKTYYLGRFFQPVKYKGEMRIDLHPKWSRCGKNIYIESGHNNKRTLYELNIENLLK